MPGILTQMVRLRLSEAAQADLIEIRLFSNREFGAGQTDHYMRGFSTTFRRIRDFPRLGTSIDGFDIDLRCVVHRSHRIFYSVEGSRLVVVRILHHSRDVSKHLPQ